MNPHVWWYLTRATGIVAWALLSAAVIWGLLLSTRLLAGKATPRWLTDLHRFLGGLSVTFLGLHIATLVADSYVSFGSADVLVPFASSWKPTPVALGIFAMYVLLAVEASSLAMKRIPKRWWHRIHMTSFGGFVLATGHGLTAGTDRQSVAMFGAYAGASAVVLFLSAFRALTASARKKNQRTLPTRERKGETVTAM